jgi:hypothetical protein
MTKKTNTSAKQPSPLKAQRSADELNDDICDRLKVLLTSCRGEANPEGWRKLAMCLVARLPDFKFERENGDDSTYHLPLMRIEGLIRTNYPVIETALACIIHVVEGAKSLLCYKHVVKTVFGATKEASA